MEMNCVRDENACSPSLVAFFFYSVMQQCGHFPLSAGSRSGWLALIAPLLFSIPYHDFSTQHLRSNLDTKLLTQSSSLPPPVFEWKCFILIGIGAESISFSFVRALARKNHHALLISSHGHLLLRYVTLPLTKQ